MPSAKIIDAVNNIDFGRLKALDFPVVGTNNAQPFLDEKQDIWLYYCVAQGDNYLSNRFLNFPLLRTRVIGVQLWLTGAKGFLHWAMNYWRDARTEELLNPRYVTDAGGVFVSGDSFLIYPGKDEPISSLREKAFAEGVRDYRKLCLLEEKKGRAFVEKFLADKGFVGLSQYTHDEVRFTEIFEEVDGYLLADE